MIRIDAQRLFYQLERLAVDATPLRHRQRISVIGIEVGVVLDQRRRALIGFGRLIVALHRHIRATEQRPAVGIRRRLFETRRQFGDHGFDLLGRYLSRRWRSGAIFKPGQRANLPIQQAGA